MKKGGCPLKKIPWQHHLVGSADFVPSRSCGDQNAGRILTNKTRRNSPHLHRIEQVEDMQILVEHF